MSISQNIKLIRESLGVSQTELGCLLDATKAMIHSYESGRAEPKLIIQDKLSEMTEIPIAILNSKALGIGDIKLPPAFIQVIKVISKIRWIEYKIAYIKKTYPTETSKEYDAELNKEWFSKEALINTLTGLLSFGTKEEAISLLNTDFFNTIRFLKTKFRNVSLLDTRQMAEDISKVRLQNDSYIDKKYGDSFIEDKNLQEKVYRSVLIMADISALWIKYLRINGDSDNEVVQKSVLISEINNLSTFLFKLTKIQFKTIDDFNIKNVINIATPEINIPSWFDGNIEALKKAYNDEIAEKNNQIAFYLEQIYHLKGRIIQLEN